MKKTKHILKMTLQVKTHYRKNSCEKCTKACKGKKKGGMKPTTCKHTWIMRAHYIRKTLIGGKTQPFVPPSTKSKHL